MIKKFLFFTVAALTVFVSCFDDTQIWDKLNEHENRIRALEQLCTEMNVNISSLQAIVEAVQKGEYITDIVSVMEGGKEVGYSITFSSGKTITVYHGKDGKDGQDGQDGQDGVDGSDGKDGYTPVIGVKKDDDGVYYWTLNGEWLLDENGDKIPATGQDGKDGADGSDGKDGVGGQDGANGADGADGKDGITPMLKIEEGSWYVSYDNGATWHFVGQATGDQGPQGPQGPQGNPGVGGDSMFTDIDYSSNPDYVIFYLGNGAQIKVPTWLAFETLQEQCQKANANIAALQAIVEALQNQDYITGVTPVYEGVVEIGYIIRFAKGGEIVIYHGRDGADGSDGMPGQDGEDGKDGQDGQNGQDGHVPVIGVVLLDGVYYWTVDGQWLLDENGNKVPANGRDGADGSNGADGADGSNGITPQLKIENGNWYVSYDNGQSWHELGQATGDQGPQGPQGPQGNPGVGGDSMFTDVDYSNPDYVIFYLGNGGQIKVPTWSAFEALQQRVEQANANIAALQAIVEALQNHDYITGVTPVYEGVVEIGYIIRFAKGGEIVIYHGRDGADGSDGMPGQDGHVPVIGVALLDGVYYWTVDGQWLLDENGNMVPANGRDGADGSNGADGADGSNGITPQLKIENGNWYVSYDNGQSWHELGQATGDQGPQGPQGNPGVSGDSMFDNVDYSNSDYVIFYLSNGCQIQVPTWSAFESLRQYCEQMNSDIQALQAIVNAIENNDFITGVNTIYEDGKEAGYVINFSKGGSITIYHGKDGEHGHTPSLGVEAIGGVYYWTIDGYWLIDGNGNMIVASGTTPQVMIQDGHWYVSYDNGQNWNYVGQATGDQGPQGNPGGNGTDGTTPLLRIEDGNWYVSYDGGYNWDYVGQATGNPGDQGPQGNTPYFMIQNGSWYVSYDGGYNWDYAGQATGDQGPQGYPGENGMDGVTPQFMIQDGNWYVSYDYGNNWNYLGQATGNPGDQGPQGDSMFWYVDYYSSNEYVYFYMTDGNVIMLPTWSAFESLRQYCEQMNQNIQAISSIVDALQNKDHLENITPIYNEYGNQIGYQLYFSMSGYVSIYNGQDGHTPAMGVSVDAEGNYYWTLDGELLLDQNGNPIPAEGKNGAAGENGITPKLKIEDNYWYISYDNEKTWKKLDKATGKDGDAFLKSVTEDSRYVSIVLADGTEFRIPKFEEPAIDMTLTKVSGNSVIFTGKVNRNSLDLKVTVYYSTYPNLTVYKHVGSASKTEFDGDAFTFRVNGLVEKTQYYFFTEVVYKGTKTYSEIGSFVTGETDSYIDWEDGENIEGEI